MSQTGNNLPVGWTETNVGAICDVVGGGTPSTEKTEFWDGEFPWITSADIYGINDIRPRKNVSHLGIKASATNLVPRGSIIVVTRVSLGKVAMAEKPICFSQDSQGLVFNGDQLYGLFLTYYLSVAVQRFRYEGRGTTISGVTKKQLRELPILLPPLAEQRRIVAEIEKQFTRLDASVAALKRVQANLKRYRTAVLKAACEGSLVPTEAELARAEGRGYEPAAVLLERILAERRARWEVQEKRRGKYKEPQPPDTSDLPDLPEGWVWATLSQISHLKGGVTKGQRSRDGQQLKEIPYLSVANVQRGFLDLSHVKTIEVSQETLDDLRLIQGDILFTEGGDRDKLGRGWVWNGEIRECIHQNHIFRSRLLFESMRPELVSWWGNSFGKTFFSRSGKQTTNLASINLSLLANFPIPILPIAEQQRIVAEVGCRLSAIQQAEHSVASSMKRAERLRQSILKRAFAGQLVSQDPSDEPASELLERIRAEREEAQAVETNNRKGRRRAVPAGKGKESQ